jgi:hypothetical protein
MLVNQMAGEWKVSKKAFKSTRGGLLRRRIPRGGGGREEAFRKTDRSSGCRGKLNSEADELSRVAYREQLRKRSTPMK